MESGAMKLRRRDGATMIMALFAFLIAAIVSTVMVSAAMTALKAAKRQQTYEQAYLCVQSTEDMISGMVGDIEFDESTKEFKSETASNSGTIYLCDAINSAPNDSVGTPVKLTFSQETTGGTDVDALISRMDKMDIYISVQKVYATNKKWIYDTTIEAVDKESKNKSYASEVLRLTYNDEEKTWTATVRRKK